MSTVFSVATRRAPAYGAVTASVGPEGLVCAEGPPEGRDWPVGVRHFHEDGVSARGVEVERTEDAVVVRVAASSSAADWDLAHRFLRAFSTIADGTPVVEEGVGTPMDLVDLSIALRPDELVRRIERDAAQLAALVEQEGASADGAPREAPDRVTVPGAVRPVHVGRATLARLRAAGPPEELGGRLTELLTRVQWIEGEGVAVPSVVAADDARGRPWSGPLIVPGVRLLLPTASHHVVLDPDADAPALVVPAAALTAWAGAHVLELVDDVQAVVEIPSDVFATARAAARERAVAELVGLDASPFDLPAPEDGNEDEDDNHSDDAPSAPPPAAAPSPKKPWWKLW